MSVAATFAPTGAANVIVPLLVDEFRDFPEVLEQGIDDVEDWLVDGPIGMERDKIDEYRERLAKAGVEVTPVVNHDASPNQASKEITPSTFVRSIYFLDPDGIQLEFAAWTREMNESDVNCEPHSNAAG